MIPKTEQGRKGRSRKREEFFFMPAAQWHQVKQEEGLTRRREDAKKSDLRVFFLFAFFLFTSAGRAARGSFESKAKTRRRLASFHFA
ncbi:MAG: hypothetical protein SF339_00540, partial [Blastocatellia bacterium]|nr:hypothetical protein [Blastocatellia bacterium]